MIKVVSTPFLQGHSGGVSFHGLCCTVRRFCFRCRGHDEFKDLGNGKHWLIILGNGVIFGQEDVGTCLTLSVHFGEKTCVRMGCKNHGAGAISDSIGWVHDHTVKELVDSFGGVFSGIGLL